MLFVTALALLPACDRGSPREDAQPDGAADADREPATVVEGRRMMMGTMFQISVADVEEEQARAAITAAFEAVAEVERRLSPHREESEVSRINAAAGGEPVAISAETVEVLRVARQISERSNGAFDVTFAALSPVWRSLRATPPSVPSDEAIEAARALVDYRQLVVDYADNTASLRRPSMAIDLGAIGKGHGVDRAGAVLAERGIENFLVGGGGDLLVRGTKRGTPWRLGVQHPRRRGGLLGTLTLGHDEAVVTSGDYERFVEIDGRRYHHIIDPRTGRPVRGTISVTLTAPNATLADGLSTAVFVLGPTAGMALVEATEDVEALIIDEEMNITMSPGMRRAFTPLD